MSVLAHVVLGGAIQSEPAATQALAFILNSSTDIDGHSSGYWVKQVSNSNPDTSLLNWYMKIVALT